MAGLGAEISPAGQAAISSLPGAMQDAWRAGSTLAVADAVSWCRIFRMPPPKWLDKAVQAAIVDRRTAAEEQRHYIAKLHYLRWDTVTEMRKRDRASPLT